MKNWRDFSKDTTLKAHDLGSCYKAIQGLQSIIHIIEADLFDKDTINVDREGAEYIVDPLDVHVVEGLLGAADLLSETIERVLSRAHINQGQ